jgi:hypothetical protein
MADLHTVAVEKKNGLQFLDAVFDCYERGECVALIDQGTRATIPGTSITRIIRPESGGGWFSRRLSVDPDDGIAQISQTSGTTGIPKSIALSQRALADVSSRLRSAMEFDDAIREYIAVPVTYSFGLGRARTVAEAGGQSYVPENGFHPGEFAEMLGRGEVNALSIVPTLLRVLLQNADAMAPHAHRLRWMEIGSQQFGAEEKRAVRELFPRAILLQHYGLTEASRSTFLRIDQASDTELGSVGKAYGKVEVRIDDNNHICIRGPHVAEGILTASGLQPIADREGWLATQDLGLMKGDLLFFEGRSDDQINIGGIKIGAEALERKLFEVIGPLDIAITSQPDPLRGEAVAIFYTPQITIAASKLKALANDILRSHGIVARDAITVVPIGIIPRTATGKIQRHILKDAARSTLASATIIKTTSTVSGAEGEESDLEAKLISIWEEALGVSPIGRNDSFFDIGGDSLSAIAVIMRMEKLGIDKAISQQIFEGKTIAEIASSLPAKSGQLSKLADAINVTRGILALIVVGAHWLPFVFDRAGAFREPLEKWTFPLFRIGTPGFAMIFGIGVGFFYWPIYGKSPSRFHRKIGQYLTVLGSGILCIAALYLIEILLTPQGLDEQWPTRLFYSVLLFYFLMIATMPLFMKMIAAAKYRIMAALGLSVTFYCVSLLTRTLFADAPATGIAELVRIAVSANYSYFELGGSVFLGAAMGLAIRSGSEREDLIPIISRMGILLCAAGVLIAIGTGTLSSWFTANLVGAPTLITYFGVVLLLLSSAHYVNQAVRVHPVLRIASRTLAIIGILALALFVVHVAIFPIKSILVAFGLSENLARLAGLTLFFVAMATIIRRTYRLYYG